jgi:hypothetical protein
MSSTTATRPIPNGALNALAPSDGANTAAQPDSFLHDIIGQLEAMLLARHASSPLDAMPNGHTGHTSETGSTASYHPSSLRIRPHGGAGASLG